MHHFALKLIVGLCLSMHAVIVRSADLNVAVASNFLLPMKALVAQFEASTPYTVSVSSGSSGKLYAQIKHGAPFHVFFSADQDKPRRLVEEGLASADSQWIYAAGRLVAVSSTIPSEQLSTVLRDHKYKRLAIANPKHAPYGIAALEVLNALNVLAEARPKLIRGENINQAFQFVRSGNADLGLVALSQMQQNESNPLSYWVIPDNLYQPIHQAAVLLHPASAPPAASAFLTFIQTPNSQALIRSFGYGVPAT